MVDHQRDQEAFSRILSELTYLRNAIIERDRHIYNNLSISAEDAAELYLWLQAEHDQNEVQNPEWVRRVLMTLKDYITRVPVASNKSVYDGAKEHVFWGLPGAGGGTPGPGTSTGGNVGTVVGATHAQDPTTGTGPTKAEPAATITLKCAQCHGLGTDPAKMLTSFPAKPAPCGGCGGSGAVTVRLCPDCRGLALNGHSGSSITCPTCLGKYWVRVTTGETR